jgi:hypothetical protein
VSQGDAYHIALDGFGGGSGDYSLQWLWTAATLRRVNIDIGEGGQVVGPAGLIPDARDITLTAKPDKGYVFTGWAGLPDGANTSDNPLTLTVSSDLGIQAIFEPVAVTDDFESGQSSLAYQLGNWSIVEVGGNHVMQSGVTGDASSATLAIEGEFVAGSGRFDVRVSSEESWDLLHFSIDGKKVDSWSGDVSWLTYLFQISAGHHRLEWSYTKDASQSEGFDTAWIDNLDLPLMGLANAQQPAAVRVRPGENGALDLEVQGQPGVTYALETSKGLVKWQEIHRATADDQGRFQLRGVVAEQKAQSFFRAVTK